MSLNILFLNAGRRNELIACFRRTLHQMRINGRLIATDIQPYAPALYAADEHHLLPRSRDPEFLARFCELCRRQRVHLIVPLIDPDLPVLAAHKAEIERTGARVLVSHAKAIAICRDKYATAKFLRQHGLPTPAVFAPRAAKRAPLPIFIKPRDGSAGLNAFRANTPKERDFFLKYVPNPIAQEYIDGVEITTDVFSDWQGIPHIAVPRRRLRIRAGEVSVGRVERQPVLEALCLKLARALKTVGPINIQAFLADEKFYITEINPRFGGGAPLAIRAGAPLVQWTILLALNRPLPEPPALRYGLTMLRYDAAVFRKI